MKTLRTIWATLLVFSLSACMYQTVSDNDWDKAERICQDRRGVDKVHSHSMGWEVAVCKDGSKDALP
jgi:hypothetical protein